MCEIVEVDSDPLPGADPSAANALRAPGRTSERSGLEVNLDRLNQWNEPGEKLQMNGMSRVGV